jgi:putative aminopeptidase FrvX
MDEIGMMVGEVVDGFIYVHRISGVDNRVMLAQPVVVHGKRALPGVVASIPPHLLSNDARKKYPSFDELVVDVGLPADEVTELVRLGDLITPDAPMIELQGTGRREGLDDRACVAVLTVCLDVGSHAAPLGRVRDGDGGKKPACTRTAAYGSRRTLPSRWTCSLQPGVGERRSA